LTPASYVQGHQLVVRAKRFKLKSGANALRLPHNAVGQQRLNQWLTEPAQTAATPSAPASIGGSLPLMID
jgi:hypothetical protein